MLWTEVLTIDCIEKLPNEMNSWYNAQLTAITEEVLTEKEYISLVLVLSEYFDVAVENTYLIEVSFSTKEKKYNYNYYIHNISSEQYSRVVERGSEFLFSILTDKLFYYNLSFIDIISSTTLVPKVVKKSNAGGIVAGVICSIIALVIIGYFVFFFKYKKYVKEKPRRRRNIRSYTDSSIRRSKRGEQIVAPGNNGLLESKILENNNRYKCCKLQ